MFAGTTESAVIDCISVFFSKYKDGTAVCWRRFFDANSPFNPNSHADTAVGYVQRIHWIRRFLPGTAAWKPAIDEEFRELQPALSALLRK